MASQSILTRVSALPLKLANKSIPSWPNPEQSIDDTLGGIPIHGKTYWSLRGPAYEAWKTIDRRIGEYLTDREDELHASLDKGPAPHSWHCFMVGRVKTKACPYIVIACRQAIVRMRIMNIIKMSHWWPAQLEQFRGFGRFSLLPYAPRHLGSAGSDERVWAPLSGLNDALSSVPVFAYYDQSTSSLASSRRMATLGGIIYLDYRPYGLTVAHAFEESPEDTELDSESLFSDQDSYYEDPLDDDTDGAEDMSSVSIPESLNNLTDTHATDQQSSNVTDGPSILLGRLTYRSSSTSNDGTDWALVELSETTVFQLELRKTFAKSTLDLIHYNDIEVRLPEDIVSNFTDAVPVYVTGRGGRLIQGRFHAQKSLVCLAGSTKYSAYHTVTLNEDLLPGDCGKWIFDNQGNWYGHVVAGVPGLRIVYVDLASEIVNSIQRFMFGISFDLSSSKFLTGVLRDEKAPGQHENMDFVLDSWANAETPEAKIAQSDSNSTAATILSSHGDELITIPNLSSSHPMALKYAFGSLVRDVLDHGDISSGLAMRQACEFGHEQAVQLLLHRGVVADEFAIEAASGSGHEKIVQMLLDKSMSASSGAIKAASENGHARIVELSLAKGVVADSRAIEAASGSSYEKIVEMLLNNGVPATSRAVRNAIEKDNERITELLLAKGVVADSLAIEIASGYGQDQTVKLLLDHGVKASSQALSETLEYGHEQVAELLLRAGARPGGDALLYASKYGHKMLVPLLLDAGMQADERTIRYAREYGHHDIVRMLRGDGAWTSTSRKMKAGVYRPDPR